MSSPTPDSVKAEIDAGRMKVGNAVLTAAGAVASPTKISQMTTDASGNLQVTDALPVHQNTITAALITARASGTTGVLTQTFVIGSDVTTATIGGYIRVGITNDGTGIATGSYYLPVYTIV